MKEGSEFSHRLKFLSPGKQACSSSLRRGATSPPALSQPPFLQSAMYCFMILNSIIHGDQDE